MHAPQDRQNTSTERGCQFTKSHLLSGANQLDWLRPRKILFSLYPLNKGHCDMQWSPEYQPVNFVIAHDLVAEIRVIGQPASVATPTSLIKVWYASSCRILSGCLLVTTAMYVPKHCTQLNKSGISRWPLTGGSVKKVCGLTIGSVKKVGTYTVSVPPGYP